VLPPHAFHRFRWVQHLHLSCQRQEERGQVHENEVPGPAWPRAARGEM